MKYLVPSLAILFFAFSSSFAQSRSAVSPVAKPVFAAQTMDGRIVDTASLRGKIVVLNLWFINCPNCVQEIKALNQLVDEHKDNKDVVFLGLAASNKAELQKFLVKNPFKYEVIPNATMIILSKFGTPDKNGEINVPFPMHYVLDREGSVVVKAQGSAGIDFVKNELKRQLSAQTTAAK
jgi:peroxiredoxin